MIDQSPDSLKMADTPSWVDRAEFPFRSMWLDTSFGRIHLVDEGAREADVVLLVHGTPSWCFEYRHLIARLARTRRVIAFDHLGFGLSERPRAFSYTPEAHGQVLREVVQRLGLLRFALVVHDYGGPIALPFAAAEPERITSLVVMNSWMWPLREDPQLARTARFVASWMGRFMYRFLNASLRLLMPYAYADKRKLTPRVHAQYLAPFRDRDARELVLWTLARALHEPGPALGQLWADRARLAAIPTQVVWGLGDRALPASVLARIRTGLPQAQVQELDGVGHWPQEEAPERVAALLDGFLPCAAHAQGKLASA